MKHDNRRFAKGSGAYICQLCNKRTRDTGRGEAELEMCAHCLLESYAENAAADNGANSPEHLAALEQLRKLEQEQAA